MPATRRRTLSGLFAALGCVASAVTACGSSGGAAGSTTQAGHGGSVTVLYAGSLVDLMQNQLGPGFTKSTGYRVSGISAGSSDLAAEIKGKIHRGDVFISASPAVDATLQGAANGNWVSWFGTYATSGLVLGYNPKSRFAADLRSKPWYSVVAEPGFRLGMTDPATDPKGVLAAQALTDAASKHHLQAVKSLASSTSDVFPEETLVGRLQAGQLDAGFFYSSEAVAAKIPTVPLTGEDLKATYTVTVLKGAPDERGAEAFVRYLLGTGGRAALKHDGFALVTPPTVTGAGVPAPLRHLFAH